MLNLFLSIYFVQRHFFFNPSTVNKDWAVKSWTNSIEKMNLHKDIVFFGNSLTYNSDFRVYFKDSDIANLGYAGDNISGMIKRIPQIVALSPNKIFIMAGINDMRKHTEEEIFTEYKMLIDSISKQLPECKMYVESILPVNHIKFNNYGSNAKIANTNNLLQTYCQRRGVVYIDLYNLYIENGELPNKYTEDGIHLTPSSYDVWADAIKNYVLE